MKKQKIAIIGLGRWGKILLQEFLKKSEVVYCCTRGNKNNLNWLHDNHQDIKHTTDYEEILTDPSIDVIVIATPIKTHFELAKKALLAKKHVFLEKPPSTKLFELKELIDLSKKLKKILFIDHIFHYHPNFINLKEIIKNEKIIAINTEWFKYGSFKEDILWNLAYHDLYLIIELIGSIVIDEIEKNIKTQNKLDIVLKTKSEVNLSLYIDRESSQKEKIFHVKTSNIEYFWKNSISEYYIDQEKQTFKTEEQPMAMMIEDFMSLLNEQKDGLNNQLVYETVKILEILDQEN